MAIGKVIVPILIAILLACLLCNIHDGETYSWLSGIWHGVFFVPNFIRHLVDASILYKASSYTTMYNIYWWGISVVEIIGVLPMVFFVIIAPIMALTTPKSDLE